MTIEVIGAGFGRTGTNSLKLALERLGLDPCYHMFEVAGHPEHAARWLAAARGEAVDWDALLAGYRAAVDWPAAYFWRELAAHWPRAKVVLTVRDRHAWWRSARDTIVRTMSNPPDDEPQRRERLAMAREIILDRTFAGRFEDRAHAIDVFERHVAEVEGSLPRERLLVYDVAQGWGPLTRFLGVPEPNEPFPLTNTTREFRERLIERRRSS